MRRLYFLWPLFAWLLLASTTVKPVQPVRAVQHEIKPGLWKLSDKDTTIYLFGTIHILPRDFVWRTPVFDAALARSSALVLEVADLDDQAANQSRFLRLAVSPGLPSVIERVPADRRASLRLMIDKAGSSVEAMSQYESWAVALSLAATAMTHLDAQSENGIEQQLTRIFRAKKRPISGLETSAQQLGFFDQLPKTAQRVFLVSLIDEQAEVQQIFDEMIAAWAKGDEEKIALTFDDELALSPELMESLLRQRNRTWATWLEKRLRKPGTIMVAVGAGHLAGKDSVQALLTAKGLAVSRVQ